MGKEILETKEMGNYTSANEIYYVYDVAQSYGYDIGSINFDFIRMLASLYHYGQIVGIRSERAKRRRIKA